MTAEQAFVAMVQRGMDPGGYHLEVTKWGSPSSGRVKVSTHVENLGDLLANMRWINDVLSHWGHFEEGEE